MVTGVIIQPGVHPVTIPVTVHQAPGTEVQIPGVPTGRAPATGVPLPVIPSQRRPTAGPAITAAVHAQVLHTVETDRAQAGLPILLRVAAQATGLQEAATDRLQEAVHLAVATGLLREAIPREAVTGLLLLQVGADRPTAEEADRLPVEAGPAVEEGNSSFISLHYSKIDSGLIKVNNI